MPGTIAQSLPLPSGCFSEIVPFSKRGAVNSSSTSALSLRSSSFEKLKIASVFAASPAFESPVCNLGAVVPGLGSTFEKEGAGGIFATVVESGLDPKALLAGVIWSGAATSAVVVVVIVVALKFSAVLEMEDRSLVVEALDSFLEVLTDLEVLALEASFLPPSSPLLVTGALKDGEEELDRLVEDTPLPETLPLVVLTLTVSLLRLVVSNLITESLTLVSVTGCGGFLGALLGCSSCVIFWRS